MLVEQNGVCAICKKTCTIRKRLSIDHDHKTGGIRKLLCSRCNSGLGFFLDDPELLIAAAKYLVGE